MSSSFSSFSLLFNRESIFNSSVTVRIMSADQWHSESCKFEHTRGSIMDHEMDQESIWTVITSESDAEQYYTSSNTQLFRNYDWSCSVRSWKIRVIGLRKLINPWRESIHNYKVGQSFVVIVNESEFWALYNPVIYTRSKICHLFYQWWIQYLNTPLQESFKFNWREKLFKSPIQFLQDRIWSA